MSLFSSIGRTLINPMTLAQLAMGPAGWAALAMRTVGTAILQQVIQQVGQKLGLPQFAIDAAKSAFSQAAGIPQGFVDSVSGGVQRLGEAMGASPFEIGQAAREANTIVDKLVEGILKKIRDGGQDEDGSSSAGQSRLVKLAKALGKLLDKKMDRMIEIGEKMDKAQKQGSLSAEMQAVGQELSMISNALNNAIKSIGESNTTLARKS
jgi:hypothetical protein